MHPDADWRQIAMSSNPVAVPSNLVTLRSGKAIRHGIKVGLSSLPDCWSKRFSSQRVAAGILTFIDSD
jgi:hypothetical protein